MISSTTTLKIAKIDILKQEFAIKSNNWLNAANRLAGLEVNAMLFGQSGHMSEIRSKDD